MGPLQVVWFKRDLRLADHRPLRLAGERGAVLPLFVVEPQLWSEPDAAARQWLFCAESLEELRTALGQLGQPLVVRLGEVEQVLERARRQFGIGGLWSHEETGNGLTYARDRRVARWAREHGIPWTEIPQFGVIRRLSSREGWARRWEARMAEPLTPPPPALMPLQGIEPGPIPSAGQLGLAPDPCPQRQRGGRCEGLALLHSFLVERGARYHRELSSPLSAERGCSRLSAHLAWGTLSLREVIQASRARGADLRALPPAERGEWPRALRGFEERLHWHCHFIQKLEDQPDLEFRSLHPLCAAGDDSGTDAIDGDAPERFSTDRLGESLGSDRRAEGASIAAERLASERLAAWAKGRTGIPFVDACMRSLIASGWLNFRMRAMLVSVACHHLELGWREAGLVLARRFVDYEAGIHWSQCQMQAGTTGINTIRIYNPIKQGQDHDPMGLFLRRWLPELAAVPLAYLHQPWTLPPLLQQELGCEIGSVYPLPIVDIAAAARAARERLWARRDQPEFAALADAIQQRHGSRRSGLGRSAMGRGQRPSRRRSTPEAKGQLSLNLALE